MTNGCALECGVGFRQLRTCRRTRPGQREAERLRGLEVKRMSAAPRRAQARGPGTKPRLLDLGEGFDLHEEIRVGQLRDGDRRTRRRGRAEIVLA